MRSTNRRSTRLRQEALVGNKRRRNRNRFRSQRRIMAVVDVPSPSRVRCTSKRDGTFASTMSATMINVEASLSAACQISMRAGQAAG